MLKCFEKKDLMMENDMKIERPNPEKLSLHDRFFLIKEKNNIFERKKEYRIIDGKQWYRYSKPTFDYSIEVFVVEGILKKELVGEWDDSEVYDLSTQFYLRGYDKCFTVDSEWFLDYSERLFLEHSDALNDVRKRYEKDREKNS